MTEKPNPDPNVRIFSVDTRFQQMARRPGGVPKEQAILQAQSQMDDFKEEFVDWVGQEVKDLAIAFKRMKNDGNPASQLNDIYRRCCQLRDTGTTMGLELITFVSDNLCQVLDTIKNGAPYDADIVECHIDAMMLAKQKPYRNLRPDQVIEMTNGLQQILDRTKKNSEAVVS
jgi:chemotaxis protein histidine kinase CheA